MPISRPRLLWRGPFVFASSLLQHSACPVRLALHGLLFAFGETSSRRILGLALYTRVRKYVYCDENRERLTSATSRWRLGVFLLHWSLIERLQLVETVMSVGDIAADCTRITVKRSFEPFFALIAVAIQTVGLSFVLLPVLRL